MRIAIGCTVLGLCVLLGCSDDDADATESDDASTASDDDAGISDAGAAGPTAVAPEVEAEVVPFPFTKILSKVSAQLLVEIEDGAGTMTLHFRRPSPELEALTADEILVVPPVSPAPYGLIQKVLDVARSGEELIVRTVPASPLTAFRKVDITVRAAGPKEPSSLPAIASALTADSSGKFPFEHDVDWVVFDGDKKDQTTEDRVLVEGQMKASVGYTFHLAFDWGALEDIVDCVQDPDPSCITALNPLEIASGIGLEVLFVSDLTASADLRVSGAAALSFEREIPLVEPIVLATIPAGPIVLTPRLAATAGVRGGASARLDVELAVEGGVQFGIEAEGASVTPVGKGPYLETPRGSADVESSADVRAWVNPRIEMLINGFVGPTIGAEPYVEVTANNEEDPCWHLTGGLDATLGITLVAGPVVLIDEHDSIPIKSSELDQGQCALPPGGVSIEPTFTPWASATAGGLYSSGSSGDSTAIAPTHDGNYLITASTANGLLKVDAQGEPLWIRKYVHDEIEPIYPQRAVSLIDGSLLVLGNRGAVLRTDEVGALLETHALLITDQRDTEVSAVARTAKGGALAAGQATSSLGGVVAWLARFAPDGSMTNSYSISGAYELRPKTIVLLEDGGALIAGEAFDAGKSHAWAARMGENGEATWFVRLVDCALEEGLGEDDMVVHAAALTRDGNFVLAGYTFYPDYRGMLVKLSMEGELDWGQTYESSLGLGVQLDAVAELESGGFLIAGTQVDIGTDDAIFLAETDSAGNIGWMQRYNGAGRDGHVSLWRTPADNGVLLAATAEGLFDELDGALLLKVPRKNGEISFGSGAPATVNAIEVSDAGVCIGVEPYPDGGIFETQADFVPWGNVVDEAVTPEHISLTSP